MPRGNVVYLLGLIVLTVLPTLLTVVYQRLSHDPSFRPLDLTEDALRGRPGARGERIEIVARVDWAPGRVGGLTPDGFEDALSEAFRAKGVRARVTFQPGQAVTRVSYQIGPSTIGPFPAARAADGISAAVEAFRMYSPAR